MGSLQVHDSIPDPPILAKPMHAALALALLATPLGACNDHSAASLERAALVHIELVQPRHGPAAVTLTGEIQARFSADLSYGSAHFIRTTAAPR
jgi:membrane fusion protein, multidrug efflux system